jgi:hypothetical protein
MSTRKWDELSNNEQAKFQNDENVYEQWLQREDDNGDFIEEHKQEDESTSSTAQGSSSQTKTNIPNVKQKLDIKKVIRETKIEFQKDKVTVRMPLKANQDIFLIDLTKVGFNFEKEDDLNLMLSKDNQMVKADKYKKTASHEIVEKVFKTIFLNEKARISLRYLCTYTLGGKYKADRKKMNLEIVNCLWSANIFPYGVDNKCGYNGLLKLAPITLSMIREKTLKEQQHPKDLKTNERINYYAAGYESNFEYESLKLIGCNQASIDYCFNKLLLSIDLLQKKKKQEDSDIKLLRRLVSFIRGYSASAHVTDKDGAKRVLASIKDFDLGGSDIGFDLFGYK